MVLLASFEWGGASDGCEGHAARAARGVGPAIVDHAGASAAACLSATLRIALWAKA